MEQKRVSFKVAKAIKEAGYPQYNTNVLDGYDILGKPTTIYSSAEECEYIAPTYLDVWLWLWREKKWFIETLPIKDKFHYQILDHHDKEWHSWGIYSATGFQDPEEAIEAAIEYLVKNNLITLNEPTN